MAFALRRAAMLPLILLGISAATFLLTSLVPGDVAHLLLLRRGAQPTPEMVEAVRVELGLDAPLLVQYGRWLARAVRLDLGTSWLTRGPVAAELAARLPATLLLTGSALALGLGLAAVLGTVSAWLRGTWVDRAILGATLLLRTTPDFVLAFGLVFLLAVRWPLLPIAGSGTWRHLVLPALVMGLGVGATQARLLRASLLEVMGEAYMLAARVKGLPARAALIRHGLRNALVPLVTATGNSLGFLLGGSVVVESLFAWPGMGQQLAQAIAARDLPLLQGYVLLLAALVVLVNLAVDLLTGWLDPRTSHPSGGGRQAYGV